MIETYPIGDCLCGGCFVSGLGEGQGGDSVQGVTERALQGRLESGWLKGLGVVSDLGGELKAEDFWGPFGRCF